MKKKGIALLLTGVIMASCSMPVYADREDAKLDVPYISLGADLNAQEKASVLELLGVSEKDLRMSIIIWTLIWIKVLSVQGLFLLFW